MDKRLKYGLIIATLAAAAILAAFWALAFRQQFPAFQQRRAPPPGFVPGDFQYFYVVNTIISTINIAFLAILIVIYVNIYLRTHSPFTVGLIIFALVFLVQNLTANPLVAAMSGFRPYGLGPFEFLPGLFEFIALSILLYLSIRY